MVILSKAHFQQTNPGMEHFQSKIQSQTQTIGPIGSKSQRYVSSQSIQLGNGKKSHGLGQSGSPKPTPSGGKYVSPGKKMAQIQKQAAGEKPKQGPYNKVLIVGLSQEFRSLNGVLSKSFPNTVISTAKSIFKKWQFFQKQAKFSSNQLSNTCQLTGTLSQ